MANFVNLYKRKSSSYYRDIVEYDSINKELYIAGSISTKGLITKLDEKGKVLWDKEYELNGESISFQQILKCSNGDLLAYGTNPTGQQWRNRNFFVRIRPDGSLIWSSHYSTSLTRYNIQITQSGVDEFFITSWHNTYSTVDDVEILKIDGSGKELASIRFGLNNNDDQVKGIIPYGQGGCIVFGSSSQGSGWDGFIAAFDAQLNHQWSTLLGMSTHEEILDMVQVGQHEFAIVGYSVTRKQHFLTRYSQALSSHSVLFFDAGSDDRSFTRIITGKGGLYMCSYAKSIAASYVMKLSSSLNPIWRKRLDFDKQYDIRELKYDTTQQLLLGVGRSRYDGTLAFRTDLDMTSCVTIDLPALQFERLDFSSKPWNPPVSPVDQVGRSVPLIVRNVMPERNPLCPDTGIELDATSIIQSPHLYCQAAGSDTTDGSSRGIHLRWDLLKYLGENHLPKGNLTNQYPTNIGFNRADDFVRIYRAPYNTVYNLSLRLGAGPNQLIEAGSTRRWIYTGLFVHQGNDRTVELDFVDTAEYDQLRQQLHPQQSPIDFLFQYRGVVELRVPGHLFFMVDVGPEINFNAPQACIRMETVSWPDTTDGNSRYVSCRKKLDGVRVYKQKEPTYIVCENIDVFRFQTIDTFIYDIQIVTYEDTMIGYQDRWAQLGEFSLTTDNNTAYQRLEDVPAYIVDKEWSKFNESDPGTGEFKVNVDNYKDRWLPAADPNTGLKEGVVKYLSLSQTNTQALEIILDDAGDSSTEVSYLEFLRLASLDYHGARMLGLGHIDGMDASQVTTPYIYLAQYVTEAALEEGGVAGVNTHYYMTLPTRQLDHRLPQAPVLDPVTYGLYADNGTGTPTLLSDPDGYVPFINDPYEYVRYINLFRQRFPYEYGLRSFFDSSQEFCMCDKTQAVAFGLEYKEISEAQFRRPEILNDSDYSDHAGLPEVVPIPESGEPDEAVYTHMETEEGEHRYGMYSINWFSRVSPVSNLVDTNFTDFPKRNSLLPPSNFAAQLVQEENPLIFTTNAEQQMLAGLPAGDKTLVRLTFDWNQVHNIAYQAAEEVEFFFRETQPLTVLGDIDSVVDLGNNRVRVFTKSYTVESANPPYDEQPFVAAANVGRFVGSFFTANEVAYEVESVTSGNNPQFILKKQRFTDVLETPSGEFVVTEDFLAPNPDERFLVFENLSDPSTWDFKLTKSMQLNNFLPLYQESKVEDDGSITTLNIGGVAKTANISDIVDPVDNVSPTGAYDIEFNAYSLPNPIDPDAEWYGGTIRIVEDVSNFPPTSDPNYRPPEMKVLQVLTIDTSGANLKVKAFDPTFSTDPPTGNPFLDYMPIEKGNTIDVNFHPSYRLYLTVDTNGGNTFNEATLLPAQGDGTKTTFMAARSKDTVDGSPCYSSLSKPALLLAQEVLTLEVPGEPSGPLFATRPDFYGKATYTFDTEIDTNGRTPYAVIFYRSDERKILDTLYKPSTVESILNQLFSLYGDNDLFFTDRWNGLVNVDYSGANFLSYDGYRFPQPDNDDYIIPNADPNIQQTPFAGGSGSLNANYTITLYIDPDNNPVTQVVKMADVVAEAIQGAFLPLTEQPVLYKYIKNGRVTSNRRPLVRDANGDLIVPGNTINFNVFDPFPMVVQFVDSGQTKLRFTDYTLDGSSRSFFFYFAVELSKKLEVSEASVVAGPIQLVNSAPAEQPGIRKITSQQANLVLERPAAVKLELNDFIGVEGITKFEIYRATDSVDAMSVRTMTLAKTFDVGEELVDDFSDLSIPPYGEPLFYRVVALREITNEFNATEYAPSKPSELALASILDPGYPPAPVLSYTSSPLTATAPPTLPNVILSWDKTVHNGSYHLYKWTKVGNWEKIHEVISNDATMTVDLSTTSLGTNVLVKEDDEGYERFHQFRVLAQSASGLMSLEDKVLVI
ncbi:MAG: hypothetical protein AAGG75_03970 [Bacteroidota bacterium]